VLGILDGGTLVAFVRHSNKMLVAGTEAWELHPVVQPHENDLLLDKTHGDAFQDTKLDALLKARSVGTVFVTGLVTEGCVRATCLDGLKGWVFKQTVKPTGTSRSTCAAQSPLRRPWDQPRRPCFQ